MPSLARSCLPLFNQHTPCRPPRLQMHTAGMPVVSSRGNYVCTHGWDLRGRVLGVGDRFATQEDCAAACDLNAQCQ